MPDSTVLAAKIAVLDRFFAASGFKLPNAYRAILGHPERLPGYPTGVFTEPSRVIDFNLMLRATGWFTSPGWPDSFLAIGEDPGGNVPFFDVNSGSDAVWFADHERSFTARNPSECTGLEKQAVSFGDYVGQVWQLFLEQQGELPDSALGSGGEFRFLRQTPHPLLLENYFEDSAIPYEAHEGWKLPFGDWRLFFDIVNLTPEAAHKLVVPAAEIAARQQTHGRFRAAICLLHRLLNISELIAIPEEGALAAAQILKRAEAFDLDDDDAWNALKGPLKRS